MRYNLSHTLHTAFNLWKRLYPKTAKKFLEISQIMHEHRLPQHWSNFRIPMAFQISASVGGIPMRVL